MTKTQLSPLSDPTNVDFKFVLEPSDMPTPFTRDEAYAFLVGADKSTSSVPKIVVAAAEVHDGAMIALVPSDADAKRLALEGFEDPDQLHLTLMYLGDAVDIPESAREQIISAVKRYAGDVISAQAFAVNVFNPTGDEPALVLGVGNGGSGLEELRSNVFSSVNGIHGFVPAANHSPWVPHVTLAYFEHPHELYEQAVKRTGPVTFDRIRVAFGGENTDIPLAGDTVVASTTPWYLFAGESDVNMPGGNHNLRNYWVRGEGAAKIRWGTDGSFARCVQHLGKHVRNPQGLCAEYHKAATGEWPAEKGVESVGTIVHLADISTDARKKLAQTGEALPDGSYPIRNTSDLENAISAYGRANPGDRAKVRAHIIKRARELNATDAIPEAWSAEMDAFDITDSHGHCHGHDGKFVDKPGGDLDKLKSLVGKGPKHPTDKPIGKSPSMTPSPDFGPTREENARRLSELENKAEGDEGLDAVESRELKQLRRLLSSDRDDDNDDDTGNVGGDRDFAVAAARKRRHTTTYSDEPWSGVLAVEGVESGDGRLFALGSLDWAQLPLPLMYQPANIGGHQASIMVGEITNIARKANNINGWGTVFGQALNGEHGEGIRNIMRAGGVSVDVDKVKDADVEMIYADGETNANPFAKPETTIFHRGRIRGATQVAFPAFVEAKLAFDNESVMAAAAEDCGCGRSDPLIAAAHTITIPDLPPAGWFDEPTDVKLSGALTITDEGRVYGILAPAKTHHRVMRDKTVPLGNVDYTRFHKGETIVAGGGRVVTGVITADCGHAPTQNYGTLQNRIDHYDNSCSVLANVRLGESRKGYVWVAGALNAGAQPHQVAQALGCALSGDWQPHADRPGLRDFISAHLVPVPGFPLARTQASVQYEDGVLSASSVPVTYGEAQPLTVEVDFNTVVSWKSALAASIGRDPMSRKAELAAQMREM